MPLRRGADGGAEVTEPELLTLTPENLPHEHLCCIIRTKKPHPGVETKRAWLAERLREGHVFRKLDVKGCAFIEYAPLETAWVPVLGKGYLYIYCLWVQGAPRGHGWGRRLLEGCIADAQAQGRSGVCMLGAKKQKAWLADQSFARKFGFETVDTAGKYELLALRLNDVPPPRFAPGAKVQTVERRGLTVFYGDQCPYIPQRVEKLRAYCAQEGIEAHFLHVETLAQAKSLPCVYNGWAVFWDGRFVTVNQIDPAALEKLRRR